MAAFDLKVEGASGYLNKAGKAFKAKALQNGVFLRPLGNVIYLLPPLCITDNQLEKCYLAIENSLEDI